MDIHAEKSALRRTLRRARQQLGRDERRRATRRIQRHLFRHIKRGARIGVYWPIGSELRLSCWRARRKVRRRADFSA
jgi:5-formyltetrahydrofolate cyclo-ligase